MASLIDDSGTTRFEGTIAHADVAQATVHLSSAQILALSNTTGVQLVAAPGANKVVFPIGGFLRYNAGATPYTVTNNSFAEFYIAQDGLITSSAQLGQEDILWYPAPGFVDSATSLFAWLKPDLTRTIQPAQGDPAAIINKALKLYFAWPPDGDALTLGDGTLDVSLSYFVATLP